MPSIVAIYLGGTGAYDIPFDEDFYLQGYASMVETLVQEGLTVILARNDSYQGAMKFSTGFVFNGNKIEAYPHAFTADVIYVKHEPFYHMLAPTDVSLNRPELAAIAEDKYTTYETFKTDMPLSVKVTDTARENLAQITTPLVVLKPLNGYGGYGIIITEREKAATVHLEPGLTYLAQEFKDSSAGIPGLVKGYHDLRVIVSAADPIGFIRQPAEGSKLANLAQGGTLIPLRTEEIPTEALALVKHVDAYFEHLGPRFYAIDMFYVDGAFSIIEINSQPGAPNLAVHGKDFTHSFHHALATTLKALIQK